MPSQPRSGRSCQPAFDFFLVNYCFSILSLSHLSSHTTHPHIYTMLSLRSIVRPASASLTWSASSRAAAARPLAATVAQRWNSTDSKQAEDAKKTAEKVESTAGQVEQKVKELESQIKDLRVSFSCKMIHRTHTPGSPPLTLRLNSPVSTDIWKGRLYQPPKTL